MNTVELVEKNCGSNADGHDDGRARGRARVYVNTFAGSIWRTENQRGRAEHGGRNERTAVPGKYEFALAESCIRYA